MDRTVTTVIDRELCTGCGQCVEVCPSGTLELRDEKAVVVGQESIGCGHCAAVCPEGAVRVGSVDPEASRFSTFSAESTWLPHGEFETSALVRLIASRRSCRNFKEDPVDRAMLSDLAKIGAMAPSGTNSQAWRFAVLPHRASVLALAQRIASFYKILVRASDHRSVRLIARLAGKPELDIFHREHAGRVKEALREREETGGDPLFHGATAAILVSSLRGAATPGEDALLAAQNILLAAHAMGLGTCLIGYAVSAIANDPRIRRWLVLESGEVVHAVIALGHPDERYERIAGRRTVPIRYVEV